MKQFENKNYYEILEVNEQATQQEIKKAYFKLAKKYHPDVNKSHDAEENFKKILEAYQVLYDNDSRKKYDNSLKNQNNNFANYTEFNNNFFDPTILDTFFNKKFSLNEFEEFLKKYSEQQINILYEYFWITFWSGSLKTSQMLTFKNASIMFDVFAKFLKVNTNSINNLNFFADQYEDFVNNITNEIKNYETKKRMKIKLFNFMSNIINDNNIFDQPLVWILALVKYDATYKLLVYFEQIFENVKNIKNSNNALQKIKSKKAIEIIAASFGIILIVIIFIIFFI